MEKNKIPTTHPNAVAIGGIERISINRINPKIAKTV